MLAQVSRAGVPLFIRSTEIILTSHAALPEAADEIRRLRTLVQNTAGRAI